MWSKSESFVNLFTTRQLTSGHSGSFRQKLPFWNCYYQVFSNFHKFFQVSYANTGENTASDESAKLAASIDEIKRLQETASALRHENLQLKVWRGILYYYTIS